MFLLKTLIKGLQNGSRNNGSAQNVPQTFFIKCVLNNIHKTFKQHLLTMICKCLL